MCIRDSKQYLALNTSRWDQIIHPVEAPKKRALTATGRANNRRNTIPCNVQVDVCYGFFGIVVNTQPARLKNEILILQISFLSLEYHDASIMHLGCDHSHLFWKRLRRITAPAFITKRTTSKTIIPAAAAS